MTEEIIRLLRGDEGEVLHSYVDSLGFQTIGVGRLIDKRKGGGITKEESAYLLANDIRRKSADLDKHLPWWRNLCHARQGVLLSMTFQMGIEGLLGFKNTLAMIHAGKYDEAAKGLLNSLWARQTPERAGRMAVQMLSGEWKFKEGT